MAEFDLFWMVMSHRCLSWLLYKWLLNIFYIVSQLTVLSIVNSEYKSTWIHVFETIEDLQWVIINIRVTNRANQLIGRKRSHIVDFDLNVV